jgi:surface antigen
MLSERAQALIGLAVISTLIAICMPACASAAGGTNLAIKANSTASDENVSAIVEIKADSGTRCGGMVRMTRFSRRLPEQTLSISGAVFWQWRINGHVGSGKWMVTLTCWGTTWHEMRMVDFPAVAGVGPGRQSELFVPGSFTRGSVKGNTAGVGGGSTPTLYPQGQCTWWVALLRPDLPWFPGSEGDARNWIAAAARRGIPTGTVPAVGSVAVFAPGQYGAGPFGHVAYVAAVEGATGMITVSEYNFHRAAREDTRKLPSLGLKFIYRGASPGILGEPAGPVPPGSPTPVIAPSPPHEDGTFIAEPEGSRPATTYAETPGGVVHTWSDYADADGEEGQLIPSNETVQIDCRVMGFQVADGNQWWYRIASSPWSGVYYGSADAFYNDGATSGSLLGTPFVDPVVPAC